MEELAPSRISKGRIWREEALGEARAKACWRELGGAVRSEHWAKITALILQVVELPECPALFPGQPEAPLCFPRSRPTAFSLPLASQNPEMPFAFTIGRGLWLVLLYYLGLLPFVHIPERFFICFLPTIINRYPQGPCFPSASSPRPPDASVLR